MKDHDNARYVKTLLSVIRLFPMCLCLAATAMVVQHAHVLRTEMVVDDEILSPITDWIHPAAAVALAAGYILSLFALIIGRRRKKE